IVRIEGAKDLVAASLGDSDLVEVGDWVLALGNPFGRLSGSVTAGIVSAKDRNIGIADRESFIQTDAAINPGNSGGPLVNLAGEVIGINTAISSNTGTFAGVGLAIPSNSARWVVDQLKSTGEVKRAYLGVEIMRMTADIASEHGLKPNEGVVVGRIREGSPAANAGLEPDDIILKFGDTLIDTPDTLQSVVERAEPGKSCPMEILRGQERMTLDVSVLERPKDFTRDAIAGGPTETGATNLRELGLEVRTLTSELAEELDVDAESGVVVVGVRPGSPAEMARLQPGVVILEVNRTPVSTTEDFAKVINESEKRRVLLLVRNAEGTWLQSIDWSGVGN
ncbi:MAG: PDZ domain-containing protein, partial [Planctomycetia bacterium]|nr:PDZ domain-containing protein [Planctomycetia bacterium]